MRVGTAKQISAQQHLNSEFKFEVVSIHKTYDLAVKKAELGSIVVDNSDETKRGDLINEDGKKWISGD